ncbi:MAG: hypothetical protein C4331_09935 [Meiothermus sp.]
MLNRRGAKGKRQGAKNKLRLCASRLPLFILFTLFTSLAFAQGGCADKPYTLETPQGIAGGGNLDYDGDTAVFTDGACLDTKGLKLTAPELRFDQAGGVLQVQDMEVQSSRYHFWAEKGTVRDKILLAEGVRITTCRCGDDLRLLSATMRFDTETGEAVLERTQLQFHEFGLARFQELRVNPQQSLSKSFGLPSKGGGESNDLVASLPVRADFDQGFNFGLQDFPVPEGGRFSTTSRFTLLALNLGSPDPGLGLGMSAQEGDRQGRINFEVRHSGVKSSSLITDGPVLFTHSTEDGHYGFRLQNPWKFDNFTLTTYGQIARDENNQNKALGPQQGLGLGAELGYRYFAQDGPVSVDFQPFAGLTFYEQFPNYFVVGGSLEGRYNANFNFSLRYDWSVENRPGRFWLERHPATQRVSSTFDYRSFSARASSDLINNQVTGSFRYGWRQYFGEIWAQYDFCAGCGGKIARTDGVPDVERRELQLGFIPNPLSCTDTVSVGPSIGYDFLRQGFSRAGLEFRYADCCFIWKIGYQYIFIPQTPDEKTTGKFIFGLELR